VSIKSVFIIIFLSLSNFSFPQNKVLELIKLNPCEEIKCNETNIKIWIDSLLKKTFCTNLQYSKSPNGDGSFYSFDLMVKKKGIDLPIPETDISLNLKTPFPGMYGSNKTRKISIEIRNDILAYKTSYNPSQFNFKPYSYYELALQIFRINNAELIANTLNYFVEDKDYKVSKFKKMIDDINKKKHENFLVPKLEAEENISWLLKQIKQKYPDVKKLIYEVYLLSKTDKKTLDNVYRFFERPAGGDVIGYINKTINITGKIALDSFESILLPSNYLSLILHDTSLFTKLSFKYMDFVLDRVGQKMVFRFNVTSDTMFIKKGIHEFYSLKEGGMIKKKIKKGAPLKSMVNQFQLEINKRYIKGFFVTDHDNIEIFKNKFK
jgi:hypothetical protein